MKLAIVLLLLCSHVAADVLDEWRWDWLYDEIWEEQKITEGAEGAMSIPERIGHCTWHRDAAHDALQALWSLELAQAHTGLSRDQWAAAIGETYIKYRWYTRCHAYYKAQQ